MARRKRDVRQLQKALHPPEKIGCPREAGSNAERDHVEDTDTLLSGNSIFLMPDNAFQELPNNSAGMQASDLASPAKRSYSFLLLVIRTDKETTKNVDQCTRS